MTFVNILLGLVGLSLVVFFHELGHFMMARLAGVEVEEFSLGWGPRLAGFRHGTTEYRLSALPIGGYCRMKGEDSYRKAIEQGLDDFPKEPGSYFGASPVRRILIALGGPLMNVAFAIVVFAAVFAIGYDVETWGNRIVLASELSGQRYPADEAGLRSGDAIVAIDGRSVSSFAEIQEAFALSAGRTMELAIERSGSRLDVQVVPNLDKESGAGKVGVYAWIDTTVESVLPDSPASLAGLKPGDILLSAGDRSFAHTAALYDYLAQRRPERIGITFSRGNEIFTESFILVFDQAGNTDLGIRWKRLRFQVRASGPLDAVVRGWQETSKTIAATFRGIASLFRGVNILKAVSGPARITWMVGQVASDGFSTGMASGFVVSFNFLAILSIGLFAMNLLPIPILDGGWIVLFIIEAIRCKAAKVKTVLRYQTIGLVAIAALFLLTTVGDILFFSGR
jgi:regulator of sigma E protease